MIIYKYLDQNGALKTIKKKAVLVRPPEKFNDPFDCVFWSSEEEKANAFKLFMNYQCFNDLYTALIASGKPVVKHKLLATIERNNLKQIAKEIIATKKYKYSEKIGEYYSLYKIVFNKSDKVLRKAFDKMIDEVYENIRKIALVSCFSLNNDSILMWSHYAENHTGACLEFEIDDKDFKLVNYSKQMCNFQLTRILEYIFASTLTGEKNNYENEVYAFALDPLLEKSNDWAYEQEIRCVFSNNNRDKKIFSYYRHLLLRMPPIKRIIVGCKADQEFFKKLKENSGSIPIARMATVDGEYKVAETNL